MTDFDIDTSAANYADELALLGVTGAMSYAPKGTQMPETIAPLNPPFVDFGWLSDGESQSLRTRNETTGHHSSQPTLFVDR
ncbi:phage tail protein [Corynebacterium diphtheriae]|nr:phage tail protein [Corynebacterium diphtheriae]